MAEEVVAGRYAIQEELGRGASATVFRARDTVLQRPVALKVISSALAADPEFAWRFEQEALISAKLDHPNIVTVHDVGTLPDGRAFIAMRLLEGPSLDRFLGERGTLPPEEVVGLVKQLAAALDYTHAAGLVHRDVKPSNVKVDPEGRATLTDFGIARALDSARVTLPGLTIGTPRYMSPEQVRGEDTTPATDVYSLGVMAYEMLAGRPPFEGDGTALMFKIVHEEPPPPGSFNPDLPEAVAGVVSKALEKDPAARWQSAGEFARALGEAFNLSTARAGVPADMATKLAAAPPLAATVVAAATDDAKTGTTAVAPVPEAKETVLAPQALASAASAGGAPPPKSSRRGLMMALGGIAAVAAVAGGAFFLLGGDDDDSKAGAGREEQRDDDDDEDKDATATARANTDNRRATQTAAALTPPAERTSGLGQLLPKTAEPTPPPPTPTPTVAGVATNAPPPPPPPAQALVPEIASFALCHSSPGCPYGVEDLFSGYPIYVVFQFVEPTNLPVEMDVYFEEVFEYTSPFTASATGGYFDTIPYAERPGYLELEIYAGDEWVDTIWAIIE